MDPRKNPSKTGKRSRSQFVADRRQIGVKLQIDPQLSKPIEWNSLMVQEGILKSAFENVDGTFVTEKLVVPSSKKEEMPRELHKEMSGRHLGIKKLEKVQERF